MKARINCQKFKPKEGQHKRMGCWEHGDNEEAERTFESHEYIKWNKSRKGMIL